MRITTSAKRSGAAPNRGVHLWIGFSLASAVTTLGVVYAMQTGGERPQADDLAAGGKVRRLSGDHLKLKDGRTVELAAIRLPYGHEPYAEKSREVLAKWIDDEGVRLRFDEHNQDAKGRIVAYVYANDTFINERLVREGLAFVKLRAGTRQFAEPLLAAQAEAMAEGKGIWHSVTPTTGEPLMAEPDRGTFHRVDCEKLQDGASGRVELNGTGEAFNGGLAPCGKCRPLQG